MLSSPQAFRLPAPVVRHLKPSPSALEALMRKGRGSENARVSHNFARAKVTAEYADAVIAGVQTALLVGQGRQNFRPAKIDAENQGIMVILHGWLLEDAILFSKLIGSGFKGCKLSTIFIKIRYFPIKKGNLWGRILF
jgi:hypothetical protein